MHRRNDRGASAVEYGLLLAGLAALVAVLVVGLGQAVGHRLSDDCDEIGGHIETAIGHTSSTGCTP